MRRAVLLALVLVAHPAWAKGDKAAKGDDDDTSASDDSDDDSDDSSDDDTPKKKPDKADKADKADKQDKDDQSDEQPEPKKDEPQKQDLTGHDLGTDKRTTAFEKDRFFVDKADTEKTEDATLIQGSITSSSLFYSEAGGNYPIAMGVAGSDAAAFSRMFTDLRLQTDFRHIKGSRWEGRIDARIRLVNQPTPVDQNGSATSFTPVDATHVQSGLTGQNEYEIRELWMIRNGVRTDVIIGRQFIPDLAAVKIDGVRVDYASSPTLTFLGFGGLYPLRGSRSLTTDYPTLETRDVNGNLVPAGQFVGTTGFGAAYRTTAAYGAIGGVALLPFQGESARFFATSNGYWRYGSKLDFYHFALVDLIGTNTGTSNGSSIPVGFTNLSGGVNYKPSARLRMTASYNRVDTDTLNVQANTFLSNPQPGSVVQNETYVQRLATQEFRGSVSAGLGPFQRFEVTAAAAYRSRPAFALTDGMTSVNLPGARGVELYASITDRHSIKDARLGADFVRTFGTGTVAYQRSEVLALRAFASHEIKDGKGEWEAELAYSTTKDSSTGGVCNGGTGDTTSALGQLPACFGATNGAILSLGGSLYYRFNSDWFGMLSAYLSRTDLTQAPLSMGAMAMATPTITGLTGFFRVAYRF